MLNQQKVLIYYFSGTGNARNVAHWFADSAKEKNYDTDIIDISKIDRKNISSPPENSLIGFCSPTHGFNYPPVMMYFIFRFPKAKGNKVFLINTRAGLKLFKIYFPGLSGIALLLAAIVLLLKGYKIVGMRSIDLPSNWISLHPGLIETAIKSIYDRCKRITKIFANKILDGKRNYRALLDIVQDLLIAPIAVLYFFPGRFVIAKTFYANSKCNNCNLCINNCPVKAIKTISERPFWTFKCESCMKCMNECPNRAIETGHGFLAVFLYLFYSLFIVWFWSDFNRFVQIPQNIAGNFFSFVIESILFLAFILPGYFIIHYLYKSPVIRRLIDFTSLTHFKFWNRYRSAKKHR